MRFQVVTLFPELIEAFAAAGLMGRGVEAGVLEISTRSPRAFTTDRHQSVDDAPFGGGSGMVMMPEPLLLAMESLDADSAAKGLPRCRRIALSPSAPVFDHAAARRLAACSGMMLICGRYEGIDDRVGHFVDEQLSLGDFVLNGGEVAAMAVIEAVARLLPGVLGNAQSAVEESHASGLLEYPQFTRPRSFRGLEVPEVLLSGNHGAIARYRRGEALARTRDLRPDLFAKLTLDEPDLRALREHERALLAAASRSSGESGSTDGGSGGTTGGVA